LRPPTQSEASCCRAIFDADGRRVAANRKVAPRRGIAPSARHSPGAVAPADLRVAEVRPEVSFGPFRLLPAERLLLDGDNPIGLGSRAFDLLCALTERPGVVLDKRELMAKAWPGTFVGEGNLKVQVAALRRALHEGQSGNRYIATVPARGYSFVMPVIRSAHRNVASALSVAEARHHNLPPTLKPLFGRDELVARIAQQFCRQRLVNLIGAGGIGKTGLALRVAQDLLTSFEHGVRFVDLTKIDRAQCVVDALASAIGLTVGSDLFATPLRWLQPKHMLLVLDNCEHVIGGAAQAALSLLHTAPRIHILATSREPLGIEGEHVHRLPALACPPMSRSLDADEALRYPAVRLFVEAAGGTPGDFILRDADAPLVAQICRKLDGIPLAIEAAAAGAEVFGIAGLLSRVDDPLQLPVIRRRCVAARHRSLNASVGWSYRLLNEGERLLLQRLAEFADGFTLTDAVRAADCVGREAAAALGLGGQVTGSTDQRRIAAVLPDDSAHACLRPRRACQERQSRARHGSVLNRQESVVHHLRCRSTARWNARRNCGEQRMAGTVNAPPETIRRRPADLLSRHHLWLLQSLSQPLFARRAPAAAVAAYRDDHVHGKPRGGLFFAASRLGSDKENERHDIGPLV
jgi:DNA-binding winged helix-turn-helix (wHTH) protein